MSAVFGSLAIAGRKGNENAGIVLSQSAILQFLNQRKLTIPGDVSLICLDGDPSFKRIGISYGAVALYTSNIYEKLQVPNVAAAVAAAIRKGLI